MKHLTAAATLATTLAAGTACEAQTVQIGQDHAPPGSIFLAGYRSDAVNGPLAGVWITEFFRTIDHPRRFLARRVLATPAGEEQVQSIDEQNCSALSAVLESLNGLPMAEVRIQNLSRQPGVVPFYPNSLTVRTEATSYTIWARAAQADGSPADLRVSATGGHIGGWGEFADQLLSPCWHQASE